MKKVIKKLKKAFKKSEKGVLTSALISAFFLTIAVFLLLYVNLGGSLGQFNYVHAETNRLGQSLNIQFETKVPVKSKVEYGTSTMYLNAIHSGDDFKTAHSVVIPGVLPKKHYIRIIAQAENGREYKTQFYTVE